MHKKIQLKTGEYLSKKGSVGASVYIVNSGSLGITAITATKEILLNKIEKGEAVGTHYLFSKFTSKFNLKALEPTEMTEIPVEYLEKQISTLPEWAQVILKSTISNLQRTLVHLESSQKNAPK